MAAPSETRIADLLKPYLAPFQPPPGLYAQLSIYLDLLLKWNARTNLTAIREPVEIVRRHFGESLFAGRHLASRLSGRPANDATLLDFGSGAGFPGLPIQLLLPEIRVTLAESQGKKASFLREAIRCLRLETGLWDKRVEAMPSERRFSCVTLRAVDNMQQALDLARNRVADGGWLLTLSTHPPLDTEQIPLPGATHGFLTFAQSLRTTAS